MEGGGAHATCISCSILRREVEALRGAGRFEMRSRCLDSVFHLHPRRLRKRLDSAIRKERARGNRVLLLYGDCHPYMLDTETGSDVARVKGMNCAEILLGAEAYRTLRREGAYFLLPEWTLRWRKILPVALGLAPEEATGLLRESHNRLVYLDTAIVDVPRRELAEMSALFDLPCEILGVGLARLESALREARERLSRHAS